MINVVFISLAIMFLSTDNHKKRSDFKWKNRVIVISGQNKSRIESQLSQFKDQKEANLDRKLLLFYWDFKEQTFKCLNNSFTLDEENSLDDFDLKLYGLDGGQKLTTSELTSVQEVYNQIDSMPMRIQELRSKKD